MSDVEQMLRDIESEVQYTRHLIGRSALDSRVMQAMREVPRHEFVPSGMRHQAYYNGPLPIGNGQTISQPYIVALMTDLLAPAATDVVLEIGTGSGYQSAVLSRVVKQVYSLEIVETLSHQAIATLRRLGYHNVACRVADGYEGWSVQAPFDGIIVTAASPDIPQPLVDQLKPGGHLVIPLGQPHSHQELMLGVKQDDGQLSLKQVLGVGFVPLTRHSPRD